MKKLLSIMSVALLLTLTGCKDATTSISNGNEALITVNNQDITKNDVYKGLKNQNGVTAILSKITAFIVDKEVPVTDELKEEAKKSLETFKEAIGEESFNKYIESLGYTEEQFLEEKVLINVRAENITKSYIQNNYDEIKKEYEVRKVQIFHTTDKDVAVEVQEKVKNGELTIPEAVKEYEGITKTYTGEEQIVTNQSNFTKDTWNNILAVTEDNTLLDVYQYSADIKNFYVVKVVDVDVDLEDAESTLQTITSIGDEAFAYYLKKYDFRVYDIDLYNGIKAQNSTYLVQE